MSKYEAIHELYEQCKTIEFNETAELTEQAQTIEEKNFINLVADFILQQKQRAVIAEGRF